MHAFVELARKFCEDAEEFAIDFTCSTPMLEEVKRLSGAAGTVLGTAVTLMETNMEVMTRDA